MLSCWGISYDSDSRPRTIQKKVQNGSGCSYWPSEHTRANLAISSWGCWGFSLSKFVHPSWKSQSPAQGRHKAPLETFCFKPQNHLLIWGTPCAWGCGEILLNRKLMASGWKGTCQWQELSFFQRERTGAMEASVSRALHPRMKITAITAAHTCSRLPSLPLHPLPPSPPSPSCPPF